MRRPLAVDDGREDVRPRSRRVNLPASREMTRQLIPPGMAWGVGRHVRRRKRQGSAVYAPLARFSHRSRSKFSSSSIYGRTSKTVASPSGAIA